MESIITFITDSAKRADLLRHTTASLEGDINQKLVKLCQTRFVERHVAVERFWEQLLGIVAALEVMQSWKDRKTSSSASTHLNSLLKTEFFAGVRILLYFAAHLRPLSLSLQEKGLDLTRALDSIESVIAVFNDIRQEVKHVFNLIFTEVVDVAN